MVVMQIHQTRRCMYVEAMFALIDPYAQAFINRRAATTEGYGMFHLIEHVHQSDGMIH